MSDYSHYEEGLRAESSKTPSKKSKVKWTNEKLELEVMPLLEDGFSVEQAARSLGMSRQRLYKLLKDRKMLK